MPQPVNFNNQLNQLSPLTSVLNIKNTTYLMQDLKEIPLNADIRLASLVITNMHSNNPITETINILMNVNLINEKEKHEILAWYDIITGQHYFSSNEAVYIQDGLAKSAPSSASISEIVLQRTEFTHLNPITRQHITGYFHYVDDILITYDPSHTNIQSILNNFNNIHPKL
jgi:hypothetical protein